MTTQIQTAHRVKQAGGWRDGRPVEDPEKTKRWGFVTARPSEFLVHVRRGQVRTASSGQGATCFKWPRDAVAVIPTSLQRLSFSADQVTRERVGVEVVGLAVYRIAEPLLAYRVLNFSFPERAQEKLEETLCGMFVGATRRLVANLSVDDCLQKRKTALADELLREIAPVVGGRGRPDDQTTQGWGVVIDSIEVQEVRVLSNNVFEAMQAPYRAALDEQAQAARAQAAREVATREAACKRAVEAARIE
ncbi:MAG: SPFH domain-containing protein, partial [Myxococcales bacterium]|nr:SPFH domain-containing protein [Myxococcales bacterium]